MIPIPSQLRWRKKSIKQQTGEVAEWLKALPPASKYKSRDCFSSRKTAASLSFADMATKGVSIHQKPAVYPIRTLIKIALLISLLKIVLTQILFRMRDLGIQKFKHFLKAWIVSNGIPPFSDDQTE